MAATQTMASLHLTNPLMKGAAVEEAQRLLTKNPFGNFRPGTIDGEYGPATAEATRRAKTALGYEDKDVNGAFGQTLHDYLAGKTPLPADYKQRAAARKKQADSDDGEGAIRDRIVQFAQWGINNEPQIHYEQRRPMDGLNHPKQLPLHTDCSGFSTLCYKWAGAPDPNGMKYNGSGFTGTMLQHGRQIAKSAVQPGDLVVWGPNPGHHVALVLEGGADPLLCSHGQEKGPFPIRFSEETKFQPSPVTWLSYL